MVLSVTIIPFAQIPATVPCRPRCTAAAPNASRTTSARAASCAAATAATPCPAPSPWAAVRGPAVTNTEEATERTATTRSAPRKRYVKSTPPPRGRSACALKK